jgi:dTDP-4-dehydrorhamnose reductase
MDPQTPVLVVGAEGVLGTAVSACLTARGMPVVGTSRRGSPGLLPLDLAASPSTWNLPSVIRAAVICAATTSTAECRVHPDRARLINVDATVELAARLVAGGTHVVFPSSNQVFDGTVAYTVANTTPCPVTSYGRMKSEAEAAILGLGETTLVARLTKIIHHKMPLFKGWLDALQRGQHIHPFNDLPMAPLTPEFAAEAIAAAFTHGLTGIVQISAAADVTYAEVAVHMARTAGLSASLVQPVSATAAETGIEYLPRYTTLDTTALREKLGIVAPSPWIAVKALSR